MSKSSQQGNVIIYIVLAVLIVGVVGLVYWRVADRHKHANNNQTTHTASVQPTSLSPGTDNSSLNGDLQSIGSSINQEGSDSASANSALNDSQQQIQVPTN